MFRAPHVVLPCSPRRKAFWGASPSKYLPPAELSSSPSLSFHADSPCGFQFPPCVQSSKSLSGHDFHTDTTCLHFSSRPTTFPGTWQPLRNRSYGRGSSLVAGLIQPPLKVA
eukprot:8194306-Heterocapsa_arctica.AAC.1